MGLIAAAAAFVTGLMASEVWFGWATEDDLQPNVEGLSFDEALLSVLLAGAASVVVTRLVMRSERHLPACTTCTATPGTSCSRLTNARCGCTVSLESVIGSPR